MKKQFSKVTHMKSIWTSYSNIYMSQCCNSVGNRVAFGVVDLNVDGALTLSRRVGVEAVHGGGVWKEGNKKEQRRTFDGCGNFSIFFFEKFSKIPDLSQPLLPCPVLPKCVNLEKKRVP
jgi:hypothetical protein